jgi:hypothetical protein
MVAIFVFGTYRLFNAKKKIVFYSNGMALRSAISMKLDKLIGFEDIASVRINKITTKDGTSYNVVIFSLDKGTIRKRIHNFQFGSDKEVSVAAAFLYERKIPVKIMGYNAQAPSNPIYQS